MRLVAAATRQRAPSRSETSFQRFDFRRIERGLDECKAATPDGGYYRLAQGFACINAGITPVVPKTLTNVG